MKKTWATRKNEEGVSPVVATILLIAITIILAAVLFVMASGMFGSPNSSPPIIGLNFSSGATDYVWTVTTISQATAVQQSDIYVQLKANGSITFVIATIKLADCNGLHGFLYAPATTGTTISAGDVFVLSKNYQPGTTISLVTPGALGLYCIMTVY